MLVRDDLFLALRSLFNQFFVSYLNLLIQNLYNKSPNWHKENKTLKDSGGRRCQYNNAIV